jgi:hypothetical protein
LETRLHRGFAPKKSHVQAALSTCTFKLSRLEAYAVRKHHNEGAGSSLSVKIGPLAIGATGIIGCSFAVAIIVILIWVPKSLPPFVF